jgi:hypothetical protein
LNNYCEVEPEMTCVWFNACNPSQRLFWPEGIHDVQPPVDRALKDGSSWVNYLIGRDQIVSGCDTEPRTALVMVREDE